MTCTDQLIFSKTPLPPRSFSALATSVGEFPAQIMTGSTRGTEERVIGPTRSVPLHLCFEDEKDCDCVQLFVCGGVIDCQWVGR